MGKTSMTISRTLFPAVTLSLLLAACGNQASDEASTQDATGKVAEQSHRPKSPPQFSETILCPYKKDGNGGFSPYWVAYIIDPIKGAKDQAGYVELNGRRLGPYSEVSGMMEISGDGRHIAFAAEKNKKWVVVVDGVEKYTHNGLLWPWSSWSPTLEGNSFIPQTRAAALEFSPSGLSIAYPAETADGKYSVFVNGEPGPSYSDIGASVSFVADRVKYYAFPEEKKIVEVHGKQELGPYDESYKTKISPDGSHYCFFATVGGKNILVADDKARELPGKVVEYAIGDQGFLAYAYLDSGKYRVRVGEVDLPEKYDEVSQLTLSPDNTKAAFWARNNNKWTLVAGEKELPGFGGYFFYNCGGSHYSVMWSPDSQHIAYYAREGDDVVLALDGQKLVSNEFLPKGIAIQMIVDDEGKNIGTGMMQCPQMETEAFVQAVLLRERVKCNPFTTSLLGQKLCYIEGGGGNAFMHIGEKKEGPFKDIRSVLLTSSDGKHYAYIIQANKGEQAVIDGKVRPQLYDAIYRPVFNNEDGTLDLLAVKDGNLVHVVQPF